MTGFFVPPVLFPERKPGPLTLGWHDTPRVTTAWTANGMDFVDCAIGPADPYRWVVVCAAIANNNPVTDVLINGIPSEIVAYHRNTGGDGIDKAALVARHLVPFGATCSVRIEVSSVAGTNAGGGLCVFSIAGGDQEVHSFWAGQGTASLPRPAAPSCTVYIHHRNGSSSTTINGMTQVANLPAGGGGQMSVGYLESTASGTFTRSTNTGAAATGAVLI